VHSLVSFNENAETDELFARNKVEIEDDELNDFKELCLETKNKNTTHHIVGVIKKELHPVSKAN